MDFIRWYAWRFLHKMELTHDSISSLRMYKKWVDIRTLKLGKLSPWRNTYYAYSEPDPDVITPINGRWVNPRYIEAHNRWVLSPREYALIRLTKIKGLNQ